MTGCTGKEEGVHPSIKAHITQKDGSTSILLIDVYLIVILHSEIDLQHPDLSLSSCQSDKAE